MELTKIDLGRALIYRDPQGPVCGVWLRDFNPAVDDEVRVQFHSALKRPDEWVQVDRLFETLAD